MTDPIRPKFRFRFSPPHFPRGEIRRRIASLDSGICTKWPMWKTRTPSFPRSRQFSLGKTRGEEGCQFFPPRLSFSRLAAKGGSRRPPAGRAAAKQALEANSEAKPSVCAVAADWRRQCVRRSQHSNAVPQRCIRFFCLNESSDHCRRCRRSPMRPSSTRASPHQAEASTLCTTSLLARPFMRSCTSARRRALNILAPSLMHS